MERQFLRISRFIGDENVDLLHSKKVALIGLGAVGGFCLEALARSGIGRFSLADFDKISETNINRQILALHSTIGKSKAELAKERVLDIYPRAQIDAYDEFVCKNNHEKIFSDADIIIDCIDSLNPKIDLLEAAVKTGIPVISSMGAALRKDPSMIMCAPLKDTWGCPLARCVRSGLRKRGVDCSFMTIFSPERVNYKFIPPEEDEQLEFDDKILERGRKRVMLGSLPTVTAIFGLRLAHLALQILLKEGTLEAEKEWDPRKNVLN